jgi:hypothetical protein
MALFGRNNTVDALDSSSHLQAYKEGRRDERRQIETGLFDRKVVKPEMDDAYERGRLVGLSRRRGSFLGGLSLLLLAALFIAEGVMVFMYGSFAAAGAVVDQWITQI